MTHAVGTLFDAAEAQRRAADAIARVYTHAPEPWKRLAWQSIVECAHGFTEFTADMFWLRLHVLCSTTGVDFDGIDKSSSGHVFRAAKRAGLIRKTGRVKPSARPEAHCKELPVWESLVARKPVLA